jgi:hypothetical protein
VYYFYLFICITCFRPLSLGADDFKNLQELNEQEFEKKSVGEQDKWPLTILILCAFSL